MNPEEDNSSMSSQTLKSNPTGSKSKSNSSESHLKSDSETGHIFPRTKKHARIEADADLAAIEDVTNPPTMKIIPKEDNSAMASLPEKLDPTASKFKSKSKSDPSESHCKSIFEFGHIFPWTEKGTRIEADADVATVENITDTPTTKMNPKEDNSSRASLPKKSNPEGSEFKSESKSDPSESHCKSDSVSGRIFPRTKKRARIETNMAMVEDLAGKEKPLLHRIFSTENEITLLEGMIEFCEVVGIDPSSDIHRFYMFIKGRLSIDVFIDQVANKIRNCKKKFLNHEWRVEYGKDGTFRKPRKPKEKYVFELSRKLWDENEGIIAMMTAHNAEGAESAMAHNTSTAMITLPSTGGTVKGKANTGVENVNVQQGNASSLVSLSMKELSRFANGCLDDLFLRRGLDLISHSKREELEHRWVKLNLAELQVQSDRGLILHEMISSILDAYQKN